MERHFESAASVTRFLARNLLALGAAWVVAFAFVQVGTRFLGGWPASGLGQTLALIAGVAVAFRMRAPIALYVLAAMTAYSASELAIQLTYGLRSVQGAPAHFAVMAAGLLGVVFGAAVNGTRSRARAAVSS